MRATALAACVVGVLGGASIARADLTPARTYNTINRPLIVSVQGAAPTLDQHIERAVEPEGSRALAEAELPLAIDLYLTGATKPAFTASVVAGEVDLAALFPTLWTSATPVLYYAQLREGENRIGPPLVLQPMVTPARAMLDEREPRLPLVVWPPARQAKKVYTGVRAYVDQTVLITTSEGEIEMRLRPDAAPNTVWAFRELVAGGFYDGAPIHRVIGAGPVAGEPFIIQAGDPTGTGEGGPGFEIPLENSPLKHDYGVVSLARQAREVNSGSSQFFVCLSKKECSRLDGQYAAFGEVTRGMDVVSKIAKAPLATGSSDKPLKPVMITKMELQNAKPYGLGAAAEKLPTER